MLRKAIFLVLLLVFVVNAACPPGCEQRGSYCDCLSNATYVTTNCTTNLDCEEGYVCYQGKCVLAGEVAGIHVTIPEFNNMFLVILILFAGFAVTYRKVYG